MYRKSITYLKMFAVVIVQLAIIVQISAQTEESVDKNHNEQVTIVGSFDPEINEAFKIYQKPSAYTVSFANPSFEFKHIDKQSATQIVLEPITPASVNVDKREKLSKNLLIAGFGSQFSPYVNFFHSSGKRNSHRFSTELYHLSAFKNIPDYTSPFSNSRAKLDLEKNISDHILDLGFTYQLNTNRYYGYLPADYPEITIDQDGLKQMFNLFEGNMGVRSNYKSSKKLVHSIDISGYYYFDQFNSSEANAQLSLDLYKSFDVTSVLNYQYLGAEGQFVYYNNTDTVSATNEYFVNATPYFKARYGMINFRLGLSFNYLNAGSILSFYPEVDASITLYPDYLSFYFSISGGLEKNSLRNLTFENPWILTAIDTKWKNNKFTGVAGFKGNIGQKAGYNIEAGWTKFANDFFYLNVITQSTPSLIPNGPINKFDVTYDDGSVIHLKGEITYTVNLKFKSWLASQYNIYTLNTLIKPYHKPLVEAKLGLSYLFANKVTVWTEIFYMGKRYALDPRGIVPIEITLDPFFDINLGVDYQLKKNFAVFLKLTNLLNWNYEYYYQYPVQGINVMAGIQYKF